MGNMLLKGGAINEDIIKENDDKFSKVRAEKIIHGCLKSGGCVSEAKWHDHKLIMAGMSSKRCFMNVGWMDSYLVVPRAQICFGEDCSLMKFIDQLINIWDRIFVGYCKLVKCLVVDRESPRIIFFLN